MGYSDKRQRTREVVDLIGLIHLVYFTYFIRIFLSTAIFVKPNCSFTYSINITIVKIKLCSGMKRVDHIDYVSFVALSSFGSDRN